MNSGGFWARALVLYYITIDTVRVEFIDVGHQEDVRCANIRFLHREFALFPAQAIETKICAVIPPQRGTQEPKESKFTLARHFMLSWMKSADYNVVMVVPKKKTYYGLKISRRPPLPAIFINTKCETDDGNGEIFNQVFIDTGLVTVDRSFVDHNGRRPWEAMIKEAEELVEHRRDEADLEILEEVAMREKQVASMRNVETWLASMTLQK